MKTSWIVFALVALNILLLGSNAVSLSALKSLRESVGTPEMRALREERVHLAGERARIQGKVSELKRLIERLGSQGPHGERPSDTPGNGDPPDGSGAASSTPEAAGRPGKPDPLSMELLPPEELDLLVELRRRMPWELPGDLLLADDLELLLSNPRWNPRGRPLDERELSELKRHLDDYRYFARASPAQRFRVWVEPEIPRLRDAGAYVEYGETEAPPAISGVGVSHAEPSDREGYLRLYYFYPEDYPELYHHLKVERERELEAFVKVYLLINGDI